MGWAAWCRTGSYPKLSSGTPAGHVMPQREMERRWRRRLGLVRGHTAHQHRVLDCNVVAAAVDGAFHPHFLRRRPLGCCADLLSTCICRLWTIVSACEEALEQRAIPHAHCEAPVDAQVREGGHDLLPLRIRRIDDLTTPEAATLPCTLPCAATLPCASLSARRRHWRSREKGSCSHAASPPADKWWRLLGWAMRAVSIGCGSMNRGAARTNAQILLTPCTQADKSSECRGSARAPPRHDRRTRMSAFSASRPRTGTPPP